MERACALLRFTWSIRQFNLVAILLGAFPPASPAAAEPLLPGCCRPRA